MHFKQQKFIRFLIAVFLLLSIYSTSNEAQTKSPGQVETQLSQITKNLAANNLRDAKSELQKVLTAAPRNVTAQTLAGIVADQENNLPEAEKRFALAARLAPASPDTHNNYGAILLKLNKKNEAANEFENSLKLNPNQPSALVNLGNIKFADNDFAAAQTLFEKARAIAPDVEVLRSLVVVALQLKQTERAKTAYEDYAALTENKIDPAVSAQFGAALLENNLVEQAVRELTRAVSGDGSNSDAKILLSRAFLANKDVKSAGRLLESAVAAGQTNAKIYAALADVYQTGGYYENAIPAMRLAIAADAKNDFYRFRYGLLLVDSKAPAAAVIRLQEALKEFPASAKLWLALGIAQLDDGKTTDAQASFQKALSFDAKSVPALAYLGTTFIERAQYDEAAKYYERAMNTDSRNAVLPYLLADTLLKIPASDDKRIESLLQQAIKLDANLATAHLTLGRLYLRQERWMNAAGELERAAQLEPTRADTLYQLGRVYARLKRADESKIVLAKFKELNDQQKEQRETTRRDLVRRLANTRF